MGKRPTTLAERLQELRLLGGNLSQRRLGRLAGIAPSHVRLLETQADANLTAKSLEAICRATGASMDWLWLGRGEAPSERETLAALAAAERSVAIPPPAKSAPRVSARHRKAG